MNVCFQSRRVVISNEERNLHQILSSINLINVSPTAGITKQTFINILAQKIIMRGLKTIIFLIISNTFMTFAWYGHLKFKEYSWGKNLGLFSIIMISWGLALFEYMFQVPANEGGYDKNGGPFSLLQLKTIQEAITLTVFMVFTLLFFKTEKLGWNHLAGFGLIVLAVFVIFKKW